MRTQTARGPLTTAGLCKRCWHNKEHLIQEGTLAGPEEVGNLVRKMLTVGFGACLDVDAHHILGAGGPHKGSSPGWSEAVNQFLQTRWLHQPTIGINRLEGQPIPDPDLELHRGKLI